MPSPEEQAQQIVEQSLEKIQKREKWIERVNQGDFVPSWEPEKLSPKSEKDILNWMKENREIKAEAKAEIDRIDGLTNDQKKEFKYKIAEEWERLEQRIFEDTKTPEEPEKKTMPEQVNEKATMTKEQMIDNMLEKDEKDSRSVQYFNQKERFAERMRQELAKHQFQQNKENVIDREPER